MNGLINPPNLAIEAAMVMGAGLATLHELETVYSYEDLLNMAEIEIVRRYNEWLASEEWKKKNGHSR